MANREVYPTDPSTTYLDRAEDRAAEGNKEQKITPLLLFLLWAFPNSAPTSRSAVGLAPHNLGTIDPLGGIARVDD
jgi:hypothetical protein